MENIPITRIHFTFYLSCERSALSKASCIKQHTLWNGAHLAQMMSVENTAVGTSINKVATDRGFSLGAGGRTAPSKQRFISVAWGRPPHKNTAPSSIRPFIMMSDETFT